MGGNLGCKLDGKHTIKIYQFILLHLLREANLEKADLDWAILIRANLVESQLREADLIGTNFEGANLFKATFIKANLGEANFRGANLEGAYGLSIDQLSKVKTLYNAKLDEELLIPLKEKYPALFEDQISNLLRFQLSHKLY